MMKPYCGCVCNLAWLKPGIQLPRRDRSSRRKAPARGRLERSGWDGSTDRCSAPRLDAPQPPWGWRSTGLLGNGGAPTAFAATNWPHSSMTTASRFWQLLPALAPLQPETAGRVAGRPWLPLADSLAFQARPITMRPLGLHIMMNIHIYM